MVSKGKEVWLTQQQRLNQIKAEMKEDGTKPGELSKGEVVERLESLYSNSLVGPRYFYYQNKKGWPIGKVSTTVSGTQIFSTFADRNSFSPEDWQSAPRPQDFTGPVWPPRELSDLTGAPQNTEYCFWCYAEGTECADHKTCNMENYSKTFREKQLASILLRPTEGRGYGLYAWEAIDENEDLGQYAGQILPSSNGDYSSKIATGPNVTDGTQAHIDSTESGSAYRFLNHSCNPNCVLLEGRVGSHHRILSVQTRRAIKEGEELTIDYGNEWFEDANISCLCGAENCRSRPRAARGKAARGKGKDRGAQLGKSRKRDHDRGDDGEPERPQKKRRHQS